MTKKMCIRHVHFAPVNERKTPYDIVINDHNIRLYLTGEFLDFQDTSIFDADKCIALPSFIDMQVHLRAPGQEEKEDLCSGTQAAASKIELS